MTAAVIVTKPNGTRVVFCVRPTEREAELVVPQAVAERLG